MLILRHSYKTHSNNNKRKKYKFDPKLSKKGIDYIYDNVPKYIEEYYLDVKCYPQLIVASPYYRTVETAKHIQLILKNNYNIDIDIVIEPLLSECLCNQEKKELTTKYYRNETLKENIVYENNLMLFNQRINDFVNDKMFTYPSNTWFVSHGYTMQQIGKYFNENVPYPKEFTGYLFHDDNIKIYN